MEIVTRVVEWNRHLPDVLVEMAFVFPVAHQGPHKLGESRRVQGRAPGNEPQP